jgi:hypothetical protein
MGLLKMTHPDQVIATWFYHYASTSLAPVKYGFQEGMKPSFPPNYMDVLLLTIVLLFDKLTIHRIDAFYMQRVTNQTWNKISEKHI